MAVPLFPLDDFIFFIIMRKKGGRKAAFFRKIRITQDNGFLD